MMSYILEKLRPELTEGYSKPDRISQEAWYLNLVSKQTVVLHTADYIYFLPVHSKFIIKQVYVPQFIQRLDPLHSVSNTANFDIPDDLIRQFPCGLLSFSKKIINPPKSITERIHTNYFLSLNKSYPELSKNYLNSHKQNIKSAAKQNVSYQQFDVSKRFVDFFIAHHRKEIPSRFINSDKINHFIDECIRRQCGEMYIAKNGIGEMIAAAFFTKYNNRLVLLISCSSPEGRKKSAMFLLLDEIIKKYCNTDMILDFEGSMIPGIAYFFKGFGASDESYYIYEWNEHPICILKNWVKNIYLIPSK